MSPFSPPRLIVAGPPASGKTTQCKLISAQMGVVYISVEGVISDAITSESELSQAAKAFLDNEKPIPHEMLISLISERIKDHDCVKYGWVLDGYPCSSLDLEAFQTLEISCDSFIFLDVPSSILIDRAGRRIKDPESGELFHIDSLPDDMDVDIQHRLTQDERDSEWQVTQRINQYFEDMHEVFNYFHNQLIHINGNRGLHFVKDEILGRVSRDVHRTVIFVVGAQGCGKRTHCNMIATEEGYTHLCPRELINQEQYFDSEISNKIDRITSRGCEIPARIIIELLKAAMDKAESNKFIIDSFPRNIEDLDCWYEMMSTECVVDFVLHLECPVTALIERNVSKKDATYQSPASSSSVSKKHKQFCEDSLPFINKMHLFGRVRAVSTVPPISVVNKRISRIIKSLTLIPPFERSMCIVKPDAVRNGNVPDILSTLNKSNLAIIFTKFVTLTADVVNDFFAHSVDIKNKAFKKVREFLASGPSLLIVVEGSDVIRRLQELVGPEKDYKLQPSSLRCQFGTDTIRNGFYCSEGVDNAIRDINYWMCPKDVAESVIAEGSSRSYAVEDTVALIKPTFAESYYDDILAIIAGHGFEIVSECRFQLTPEFLNELYPEMKSSADFSKARDFMLSGPVVALQLRREAALKGWRHLIGGIDFRKTQEERYDSIRSKFAINSIENAVHGSYNSLMATKELNLFFPMLKSSEKVSETNCAKVEKPKTSRRKKRKQASLMSTTIKPSALQSYLHQDVNPVLNDLVRNLAIQKPKDIMGYAINDLIEKQKMDAFKIGKGMKRLSASSTLPALPNINHDHHISSEKSALDVTSDVCDGSMTLDAARSEISRLQETIRALSANIVSEGDSKNIVGNNQVRVPDSERPIPLKALNILSIGDLVGFGRTQDSILEGNTIACFSGAIKSTKLRTDAMVLFTGNFLGCSHTLDSTHYSSMISLIDNLGVNYGILGNRDFEFGWDDVHNHLKFSLVTWIASNVVKAETDQPFKNCEEKVLVDWNGIQVGIIGLIGNWVSNVPSCSSSTSNVKILDPIQTAKRLCNDLRNEGAEVILVMSHCEDQEVNEKLSALHDVQLLIAGHSQGFKSWKLNDYSMGVANGGLGGVCSVTVNVTNGKQPRVIWPPNYVVATNERQPYDVIDSIVSNLREEAMTAAETKLGSTLVSLSASKRVIRTSESPLGNLLTDMMREYAGCDIAILNAGAINSECKIGPGVVTMHDIVSTLPHEDYLVVVSLSAEVITKMLNNSVSRTPSADGRFLQVSGLSFEFNPDVFDGGRCFNIQVDGKGLDMSKRYTCAMSGWLLDKNDGYKCFDDVSTPASKEFCPSLIHVIRECFSKRMLSKADRYHRELTEVDFNPVEADVEGRIVSSAPARTSLEKDRNSSSRGSLRSDGAIVDDRAGDYQYEGGSDDVNDRNEGGGDEYDYEGIDYGTHHEVLASKF